MSKTKISGRINFSQGQQLGSQSEARKSYKFDQIQIFVRLFHVIFACSFFKNYVIPSNPLFGRVYVLLILWLLEPLSVINQTTTNVR